MRVISLLPAATEMLSAIGAGHLLVARSHECDAPPEVQTLPALTSPGIDSSADGATIAQAVRNRLASGASFSLLDEARLRELRPDLIITQDRCEVCSIDLRTVQRAVADMDPQPRVLSLNPTSLEDVFDDLLRLGQAVGCSARAESAVVVLRDRYYSARDHVNPYVPGPVVAFLEWLDPIFVGGRWTAQLITSAGARHPLNDAGAPSRVVSPDELVAAAPEALIIAPCVAGIDWTRRALHLVGQQPWWNELPAVQGGCVALVDGRQMFNRPGPRLVDAFCWLVGWLHGVDHLIPSDFPWQPL